MGRPGRRLGAGALDGAAVDLELPDGSGGLRSVGRANGAGVRTVEPALDRALELP